MNYNSKLLLMGRRKIQIKAIDCKKNRIDTFHKRKVGLVKKAAELSMLCGIRMLLAFEDLSGGVFRYSTHGIFEPREYFKEAWDTTTNSKTQDDYPKFFVKIPKKRKNAASKVSSEQGQEESFSSSAEEEEIEEKASKPLSIRDVKHEITGNGMHIENSPQKHDFAIDTLDDLDRCLGNYQIPTDGALNETQEFILSIKRSLERIKRRTVHFEASPLMEDAALKGRRRAVTANRAASELKNTPSFGSKRGTIELDSGEQRRSAFWRGELKDIICEEPEFGKSAIPMSPINREKEFSIDFMDDNYAKKPKMNGEYASFTDHPINNSGGHNNSGHDATKYFSPLGPLSMMFPGLNNGPEKESPQMGGLMENLLNSKEGNSKSDSDQSKNAFEISKNNAKDFWLNLSRFDGSRLENSSIMKDEQNGDLSQAPYMKRNSGSYSGLFKALENSGMMLFSPIPLTSMTTARKNDPGDWLAYSMKAQAEQAQRNQPTDPHEQFMLSLQSDSSIMKSPRLEKHLKDT